MMTAWPRGGRAADLGYQLRNRQATVGVASGWAAVFVGSRLGE
jgi:hypothetical protein